MHPKTLLPATLLLLGAVAAHGAPPAPAARLFDPVKAPERAWGEDWRAQVCALLPQPCEADTLQLVRARQQADSQRVVALANKPLARAELRRTDGAWTLEALHDFSGYVHQGQTPGTDAVLSLAPALYPLSDGRWAVAVLARVSEMYSGGGASFERADFVPLDAAPGEARAVHTNLPFACMKMIRACFSEKEYRNSPHCHDESSGSLRIAYGAPARSGGDDRWTYTWVETEWPAHAKKSTTTHSTQRFTQAQVGEVPFCGGPQ